MQYPKVNMSKESTIIEAELNRLVKFLNYEAVNYALLGNPTGHSILASDLDLCVSDSFLFEDAFSKYCKKYNCKIVNRRAHATGIRLDYIFRNENDVFIFPGPDILTRSTMRGEKIFYKDLLESKVMSDGGYYKPSPVDEFIFYFFKRIDKCAIGSRELESLFSLYRRSEYEINLKLSDFFSCELVTFISSSIKTKNFPIELILCLKNELFKPELNFPKIIFDFKRAPGRLFNGTGLVVVLLGVDGSGKTTIGEMLQRELAPMFNGVCRFHIRPYFLSRNNGDGNAVIDPHAETARSSLLSIIKLLYFLFDYLFGWLFNILPLKLKSNLVIFDRYYHDILIDPVRYRYGAPHWLAKLFGRFIPKPDLFIILDAPPAIIQARKQEVSFDETSRQCKGYLDFAKGNSNCIVLDTSAGIEGTVLNGRNEILNFMTARQAKRAKKR